MRSAQNAHRRVPGMTGRSGVPASGSRVRRRTHASQPLAPNLLLGFRRLAIVVAGSALWAATGLFAPSARAQVPGPALPVAGSLWVESEHRVGMPPPERLLDPAAVTPAASDVFARLDSDHDAVLTRQEWGRYVLNWGDMPLDPGGDGRISLDDFALSMQRVIPSHVTVYGGEDLAMLVAARELALAEKWAEALAGYRAVERDAPECAEAALGAGRCLEHLNRFQEALAAYRGSLALDPNQPEVWLDLAVLEAHLGRKADSRRALGAGLAMLESAAALTNLGADLVAERAHTRALLEGLDTDLGQGDPEAAKLLADFRRRLAAIPAVQAATPDEVARAGCGGVALVRAGHLQAALAELDRRAVAEPSSAQLWLDRAALQTVLGRLPDARASLEKARQFGAPASRLAAVELGLSLDAGREGEASAAMDRLRKMPLSGADAAEVGWQLAYRGRWELAQPWLARAADCRHEPLPAALMEALCAEAVDRVPQARAIVERLAVPLASDAPMLRVNAGLCSRLGLHRKALEAAAEAVRMAPKDPAGWRTLLEVWYRAGGPLELAEVVRPVLSSMLGGSAERTALEKALGSKSSPAPGRWK